MTPRHIYAVRSIVVFLLSLMYIEENTNDKERNRRGRTSWTLSPFFPQPQPVELLPVPLRVVIDSRINFVSGAPLSGARVINHDGDFN